MLPRLPLPRSLLLVAGYPQSMETEHALPDPHYGQLWTEGSLPGLRKVVVLQWSAAIVHVEVGS